MSFGCDRDMISIGRLDLVVRHENGIIEIRAVSKRMCASFVCIEVGKFTRLIPYYVKVRSSQVVGLHIAESDWVQAASYWILKKSLRTWAPVVPLYIIGDLNPTIKTLP